MTRHQMLAHLKAAFQKMEDPATEARALLREALNVKLNDLILNDQPLNEEEEAKIFDWQKQRLEGVPLAYLSGRKAFHKYEFSVAPGVLIPRPETELLVHVGSKRVARGAKVRIADLGCGSGCAGITLLKEIPQSELFAVDISPTACRITEDNADLLEVRNRTTVQQSDVSAWRPQNQFELIIANPPYIPLGDKAVDANVHKYEPHEALYSGAEGLDAIRAWTIWAVPNLRPDGILALEIGAGQTAKVVEIMEEAGLIEIQILKDFAAIDRIISGKRGKANG